MGQVVLIHGAWHGAWCWDGVVAELERRQIPSTAVELPLTSHADDVSAARAAIEAAGPGCVVCGHSYGGMVISNAAAGLTNVKRLVYLTAMQTEPGEDPLALMATDPSPLMGGLVVSAAGLTVDPSFVHEAFYGDSEPATVAAIAPKLRPMPAGDTWVSTDPAWKSIPSTYIVCTNDKAIMPSVQRVMAARADEVVEWPTDHSPFLTRPHDIADLLASYL